eukprot:c18170_g1_i1 orf=351-1082(+)
MRGDITQMGGETGDALIEEVEKTDHQAEKASARRRIAAGKENLCAVGSSHPNLMLGSPSPLPANYPRIPLQDITAVINRGGAGGKGELWTHPRQGGSQRKKAKMGSKNRLSELKSTSALALEPLLDMHTQCLAAESNSGVQQSQLALNKNPQHVFSKRKVPTEQSAEARRRSRVQTTIDDAIPREQQEGEGQWELRSSLCPNERTFVGEMRFDRDTQRAVKRQPSREGPASGSKVSSSLMKFR